MRSLQNLFDLSLGLNELSTIVSCAPPHDRRDLETRLMYLRSFKFTFTRVDDAGNNGTNRTHFYSYQWMPLSRRIFSVTLRR